MKKILLLFLVSGSMVYGMEEGKIDRKRKRAEIEQEQKQMLRVKREKQKNRDAHTPGIEYETDGQNLASNWDLLPPEIKEKIFAHIIRNPAQKALNLLLINKESRDLVLTWFKAAAARVSRPSDKNRPPYFIKLLKLFKVTVKIRNFPFARALLNAEGFPEKLAKEKLRNAIIHENTEEVRALLQAGLDPNESDDHTHHSLLLVAAEHGFSKIARLLIHFGAHIDTQDICGQTALMIASLNGNPLMVGTLIELGANIAHKDCLGQTALDKVERIIQIGSALLKDQIPAQIYKSIAIMLEESTFTQSRLLFLVKNNKEAVAQAYLDGGANPNVRDESNRSALIFAAINNSIRLAKKLIAHGASINARDANGWTALIWASSIGHKECVELLITHGADVNVRDTTGGSAMAYSTANGHHEISELLIAHGAEI